MDEQDKESQGQTLGHIKHLLAGFGLKPKHRYGQNFLHDSRKMQQILKAAAIQAGEVVLEVGPGTGALSTRLLAQGANLLAVEIDEDLTPILESELSGPYKLLLTDILAGKHELAPTVVTALDRWMQEKKQKTFKLIANLPYNVATPLLANLVIDMPQMTSAVVLIQKEVGDRLSATAGGKDYGPISVLIQAACQVERVTSLPPGCFWPSPKVDSAVVLLSRRQTPQTDDLPGLSHLLKHLFGQRRKQLGGLIKKFAPDQARPDWLDPTRRPESLTVTDWCRLQKHFA